MNIVPITIEQEITKKEIIVRVNPAQVEAYGPAAEENRSIIYLTSGKFLMCLLSVDELDNRFHSFGTQNF